MIKKCIQLIGLLFITFIFQSHEFWLAPNKFRLKAGDTFSMDVRVGESFEGEFWNYRESRVLGFHQYNVEGKKDLTTKAIAGEGNNLKLQFNKDGLQLLALETNNAFIELEGDKFNDYLKEDGLLNILEERKKKDLLGAKATEHYARNAKTLLQVGNVNDTIYKVNTGMPIEIIPVKNPYEVKDGTIPFKVLFEGKPLKGALVKVWHKSHGKSTMKEFTTSGEGTIMAQVVASGQWMVSAVHMIPSKDGKTDWQSYWGSLTFGYE